MAEVVVQRAQLEDHPRVVPREAAHALERGLRGEEGPLGRVQFALVPMAHAEERLHPRIGHLTAAVGRRGARQGGGERGGAAERAHRGGQPALVQPHAADFFQRFRALLQRIIGDVGGRERLEVGHRLVVDRFHDVQALHLGQLVVEVAEHEADQGLGLFLAALGGVAGEHRVDRQQAGAQHDQRGERGDGGQPAIAPLQLAPAQLVVFQVEQAGNELEFGVAPAVLARARVGGDRLAALGRIAQRRGKAFLRRRARVGFAADDQAEDALAASQPTERTHFLADPARLRRGGRADHDQVRRLAQGLLDLAAEIG
jgi:hypothetical protein